MQFDAYTEGGKTMEINSIVSQLQGCPCGRKHTVEIRAVEIGHGILERTGAILRNNGFPDNILVVADENTLAASKGILEILRENGFSVKTQIYPDLRIADMRDVKRVQELSRDVDGILSVGSGSLNDICRYAARLENKEFAIFATAPSMDGFASGTAPITENNFKSTRQARQPSIILGDTGILARSPAILKGSGFGDVIAKYVAIVDWKVSHLTTGEYYCQAIADLTLGAVERMVALADKVSQEDEQTAGTIMEALVLTGLAMRLADSVRPASGTEHIISHFWEIKKLERGLISDFHGRKVGVGTLFTSKIYHWLINQDVHFVPENLDWDRIYAAYGPNFTPDVIKLNSPTVTEETTAEKCNAAWPEIRRIVREELPTYETLYDVMKRAGCALSLEDIAVDPELGAKGLEYHPFMRHRMTLMRLIPMMDGIRPDFASFL